MNIPITYYQSTNQWRNDILGYTNQLSDEKNQLINGLKDSFEQNLDYFSVTKNSDTTQYAMLIFDGDRNKKIEGTKNFVSYPYDSPQFNIGDTIHFKYNEIVDDWLITSIDLTQNYNITGTIQQCNYNLKIQKDDSSILTIPCIFNSTSASLNDGTDNIITTIDGKSTIKCKFDQELVNILITNKRLMIDSRLPNIDIPNCYKITKVNFKTYDGKNGFLELTLDFDVFSDKLKEDNTFDNKDLQICDYFTVQSQGSATIEYETTQLKCGGSSKTFTAVFSDTSLSPVWNLVKPVGYESYITYTTSENIIKIKVLDNDDLIGKTITLNLSDNTGTYTSSLDLEIVSLF